MLVLSSIGLVLLSPSFFRLRRVVVLSPLHLQGGVAFAASSFSVVVLSRYLLPGGGVLLPSHILNLLPPAPLFFTRGVMVLLQSRRRDSRSTTTHTMGREHQHQPEGGGVDNTTTRNEEARKAQAPQGGDEGSATQRRTREGTTNQ